MIRYQNIYHMLAYAFHVLNEQGYKDVAVEKFENTPDLLSAILCRGVKSQIKRGLMKEYILVEESLSSPKGKIQISESIKTQAIRKKQLVCAYDEFTVNAYPNRIIKTTLLILLKNKLSGKRKKEIKKLLVYFSEVDVLDIHRINWKVRYDKNNQTYHMLISVCYMVIEGLLQTTSDGTTKLMDFLDEQRMCKLYETFILEYFRRHYPQTNPNASKINWQPDENQNLPEMKSDVMLSCGNRVLIIDAKYYSQNMQVQFGKRTIHSNNLYQIFTYVKNKDAEFGKQPHEVSGMLLYAKTDDEIQPNGSYMMSGNEIFVRTLDLNCDFSEISQQLNEIAESFMKS